MSESTTTTMKQARREHAAHRRTRPNNTPGFREWARATYRDHTPGSLSPKLQSIVFEYKYKPQPAKSR